MTNLQRITDHLPEAEDNARAYLAVIKSLSPEDLVVHRLALDSVFFKLKSEVDSMNSKWFTERIPTDYDERRSLVLEFSTIKIMRKLAHSLDVINSKYFSLLKFFKAICKEELNIDYYNDLMSQAKKMVEENRPYNEKDSPKI